MGVFIYLSEARPTKGFWPHSIDNLTRLILHELAKSGAKISNYFETCKKNDNNIIIIWFSSHLFVPLQPESVHLGVMKREPGGNPGQSRCCKPSLGAQTNDGGYPS